jgi:hypothetical protein
MMFRKPKDENKDPPILNLTHVVAGAYPPREKLEASRAAVRSIEKTRTGIPPHHSA